NPPDAAATARVKTLDHDRPANMGLGNDEIVDVEVVIVFGVGDRRLQAFAHVAGDALARKFEIGQRRRHLVAARGLRSVIERLRAESGLLGAARQHAGTCFRIVPARRALACFLAHVCPQPSEPPPAAGGAAAPAAAAPGAAGAPGTAGPAARFALRSDEWP